MNTNNRWFTTSHKAKDQSKIKVQCYKELIGILKIILNKKSINESSKEDEYRLKNVEVEESTIDKQVLQTTKASENKGFEWERSLPQLRARKKGDLTISGLRFLRECGMMVQDGDYFCLKALGDNRTVVLTHIPMSHDICQSPDPSDRELKGQILGKKKAQEALMQENPLNHSHIASQPSTNSPRLAFDQFLGKKKAEEELMSENPLNHGHIASQTLTNKRLISPDDLDKLNRLHRDRLHNQFN